MELINFHKSFHWIEKDVVDERLGGTLCCMRKAGDITELFDGLCIPDGLCFNNNCTRLFAMERSKNHLLCSKLDDINISTPVRSSCYQNDVKIW